MGDDCFANINSCPFLPVPAAHSSTGENSHPSSLSGILRPTSSPCSPLPCREQLWRDAAKLSMS